MCGIQLDLPSDLPDQKIRRLRKKVDNPREVVVLLIYPEAYSEPCQTSKIDHFAFCRNS